MSARSGPGEGAGNHWSSCEPAPHPASSLARSGTPGWSRVARRARASARGYRRRMSVSFFQLAAWLAVGAVSIGCSSSRSGSPAGGAPDSGAPAPCTPSTCAGTCTAGQCFVTLSTTTLGGSVFGSSDLVLGKTTLYWVEYGNGAGSILSVPAAGGATVTLASSADSPGALAVDTSHVFWVSGDGSLDGGFVASVPTSGGSPTTTSSPCPWEAGPSRCSRRTLASAC